MANGEWLIVNGVVDAIPAAAGMIFPGYSELSSLYSIYCLRYKKQIGSPFGTPCNKINKYWQLIVRVMNGHSYYIVHNSNGNNTAWLNGRVCQ